MGNTKVGIEAEDIEEVDDVEDGGGVVVEGWEEKDELGGVVIQPF